MHIKPKILYTVPLQKCRFVYSDLDREGFAAKSHPSPAFERLSVTDTLCLSLFFPSEKQAATSYYSPHTHVGLSNMVTCRHSSPIVQQTVFFLPHLLHPPVGTEPLH